MKRVIAAALAVCLGGVAGAGENLLPASFVSALCQRKDTGVTYLEAEDGMPDGVLVTTDKALDPVYSIETSAAVPGAVKKGDLLVLTAAVRGVSPSGKVSVLTKFQDGTYTGALRDYLTANSATWQWCRITGVAPKDYENGSMKLHVYPWTGAQQMEIRGWTLENLGPVSASTLPPLPSAPDWPAGELHSPQPAAEPEAEVLDPLTPEQLAKKRYVMLKFDDVKNNGGSVHSRFARVATYLAEKNLKSGFGVIVKSIEDSPNGNYVSWLKANAVENGGLIEFWDHGWDHAMDFTCKEDDACDPSVKYSGEFVTSIGHQRTHLTKSIDVFRQYTGLTMHTLGTAGNAGNADTLTVLLEHPEMKVWIFGNEKDDRLTVLGRWLNLEYAVGKVKYATFVQNYKKHRQTDYIVLQGHCAQWDDANFAEFQKVVELLESDGWTFVTPYEYHCILTAGSEDPEPEDPEPEDPPPDVSDLYVGYPGAKPAAPYATRATAAATLEDALATAVDGATIHVAPGTYTQNGVIIVSNAVSIVGDSDSPTNVVFKNTEKGQWSLNRGNFIVRNSGAVLANLTLKDGYASGTNNGGISRAGNLDLENGTVTNCVLKGGYANNAGGEVGGARVRNGLLANCRIEGSKGGNRASAIFVYQSGGRVENCLMCGAPNSFVKTTNTELAGVCVDGGTMANCTVTDFWLLHVDGKTTYTQLTKNGVALRIGSNAKVANCVFADYRFANNEATPVAASGQGAGSKCVNCAFDRGTAPNGTCGIAGLDDLFVKYEADDLRPGPVLRNAGTAVQDALPTDLAGNPRVVGRKVDIGCYEWQVGAFTVLVR